MDKIKYINGEFKKVKVEGSYGDYRDIPLADSTKPIDHKIETNEILPNEGDESSSSQISKSNQDEAQELSLQKRNSTKSVNE